MFFVYVEDHPEADATLTYHPSATVVHRCDPSGGCCRDRRKQCSPLEESVVDIFFFVHSAVVHRNSNNNSNNNNRTLFTSLPFVNHTQCICTDINDVPRRWCWPPFVRTFQKIDCLYFIVKGLAKNSFICPSFLFISWTGYICSV